MILLLRLLPFVAALLQGAMFVWQKNAPWSYPFIALAGVAIVPLAAGFIAWRRIRFFDLLEKMAPTFVLHLALVFGMLLAEGPVSIWTIAVLGGVSTFLSLELLFLYAYQPASYPMNGISRVNIAYVPIAVWYVASTMSGFMIFVHAAWYWHVVALGVVAGVLFRTTGHPGASRMQNVLWTVLGVLTGIEIAWIGVILPLSMGMQGIVAAMVVTGVLRMRRYLYDPKPSVRMAWGEAVGLTMFLFACILTAKWL